MWHPGQDATPLGWPVMIAILSGRDLPSATRLSRAFSLGVAPAGDSHGPPPINASWNAWILAQGVWVDVIVCQAAFQLMPVWFRHGRRTTRR